MITIIIGQRINPIKLQRAKEFRRKMTPTERKLWNHLRNNQLDGYHFRRQQVIEGFIADFYCNPVKLVIEVDGGIHESRQDYDKERERVIAAKGLKIVRVTTEEIENNIEVVLNRILSCCRETRNN